MPPEGLKTVLTDTEGPPAASNAVFKADCWKNPYIPRRTPLIIHTFRTLIGLIDRGEPPREDRHDREGVPIPPLAGQYSSIRFALKGENYFLGAKTTANPLQEGFYRHRIDSVQ